MGTFEDLINQIDAFIRKFYKNQMIKGVLLFLIIFLFTFLLITGLEYIGRFGSFIRAVLLFSFIGLNIYVLARYFIVPTTKLFSFGKRIDRYQAAKIIGDFFPAVEDKLLNTLQLQDTANLHPRNIEFIQASINQNAKEFGAFSFTSAIDYAANKRFLKYFLPVLFLVITVAIVFPNFINESSERLIKYNQTFEIAPDFSFELQNSNLLVEEGSEITIDVKLTPKQGKPIPDRIYISSSEGTFLMNKKSNNLASYTFTNLNHNLNFFFKALNSQSSSHEVKIIKRTSIGQLAVRIDYPKYLNRSSETIENPGDLIVPEGTKLTWNGVTKNAKSLSIKLSDTTATYNDVAGFRFNYSLFTSTDMLFVLSNKEIEKLDSIRYHLEAIKDGYPSVSVAQRADSLTPNKIYFSGEVSDDYGLSQLIFTYSIEKESGEKIQKNITVPGIDGMQSSFSMTFNLDELGLELKDRVVYFFTVYDNDGIHGPKASKSNVFEYHSPSLQELQEKRTEDKNKIAEDMKDLIRESKELKEEIARLKKEIVNSKSTTWTQQQQIKSLKDQQKSLQDRIQQTKDEMKSSFEEKTKLDEADENLLEKQKQIEEMLDNLMDDELKKLLEELEKMLQKGMDKDMLEKLEDSEMSAEEMNRQLDRTLEMLKKMDVEERIEDLQKTLENLAKEQNQLKEDLNDKFDKEEALSKQEELNKDFENLKESVEEMLEKNEALKRPFSLDGIDELMDDISKDMEQAKDKLSDSKTPEAQEKQEDASEKMEEAASQLQAQMQDGKQKQDEEDYNAMRALMENLLRLSFNQEDNLEAFKGADVYEAYFISLGREQRSIIDNFQPVKDSLRSLAERVPQVSSFIEQELKEIEKQFRYIPTHIGEREKPQLLVKQQFVMTSLNNLALFLNEAIESAQQKMKGQESGGGSCDNPGGSGKEGKDGEDGDMDGLKEMIKKQLEQLKNGAQPNGQSKGPKPGGLFPMDAEGAAKMAAEQDAIRQKLQELREELNKDGSGKGNQLNKLLEELEQQQEDLIEKKWDTQLIDRQQEILTRLLESENALRERGLDEERESKSGKDENYGNQIQFLEYKKQKEKQIELLRTLDPMFSRYYKERINEYFRNLN